MNAMNVSAEGCQIVRGWAARFRAERPRAAHCTYSRKEGGEGAGSDEERVETTLKSHALDA